MMFLVLLGSLVLVSGKPAEHHHDVSLIAEPVPDLTSGSAPAYWSAECGGRTYVGSYTLMMDWAQCRDYCTYFPHAAELGHTFSFADILDADTMECLRFNMNNQYTPGNGYAGHYWAGGYRGGDGQYRWDSGAVFEFDDFVDNPGEDPYLHLTPGNNYQWNTKNDQDDRNNGCLCKSQEPAAQAQKKGSLCQVGWDSVGDKCIRWNQQNIMSWYDAYHYCETHDAELLTWRSEAEWFQASFYFQEFITSNAESWTGANCPEWQGYLEFFWGNNTMDFVPLDFGWQENKPSGAGYGEPGKDLCGRFRGTRDERYSGLMDSHCVELRAFMCQALK